MSRPRPAGPGESALIHSPRRSGLRKVSVAMRDRLFLVACLCAALAACEKPQEPAAGGASGRELAPPMDDRPAISALPEHFDRTRAEQFEKEEDRLRKHRR